MTLHSLRHTFVTDLLWALNGDAKIVMELSGHASYESFHAHLHADEATMEKARDVIKGRDGSSTGNEMSEATGVAQSALPTKGKKRPLAPAAKAVLNKRWG